MEKDGKGPNGSAFPRAADEEEEWQMCRKIGLVRETKRCREKCGRSGWHTWRSPSRGRQMEGK